MRAVLATIDRVSLGAAAAGAAALGLMAVLIISDIAFVLVTRSSLQFVWEYVPFLMAAAFFLGLGHTLRAGGHVRVTILLGVLSPTWVRVVDTLATCVAILFSGFLTYALVQFAFGSWSAGSVSFTPTATPLYIPQTVVAVGAALFTLQLLARLVRLLIDDAPDLPPSSDTPTLEH